MKDHPELIIKTGKDGIKHDSGIYIEKAIYRTLTSPSGDANGIPQVIDSGKFNIDGKIDYFLIIPKLERSLHDLINSGLVTDSLFNKSMNGVLNALKYMSSKSYIHLDIKPENIMVKGDSWYLIDFGIATRFKPDRETIADPNKEGNGTNWFISRDVHKGLMTKRADLESLIYTMLKAKGHSLPWERNKSTRESKNQYKDYLLNSKQKFFETYKHDNIDQRIKTFIEYVDTLQPGIEPMYDSLKFK